LNDYEAIGFSLPSVHDWIEAMGYGNKNYDWVFAPISCGNTATSALPVGDNLWTVGSLNGRNLMAIGGSYNFKDSNGLFYYACDRDINYSSYSYGANLMYIPDKNNIYNTNIQKWLNHMGE